MIKTISILKFNITLFCVVLFINNGLRAQQTVSTYYNFGQYLYSPENLVSDALGNFYFSHYDQNWRQIISKVSSDGSITTFSDFYGNSIGNLTTDSLGNLFFTYYNEYSMKKIGKISVDGTISSYLDDTFVEVNNLKFDSQDNLYFTNYDQYSHPYINKMLPDGTIVNLGLENLSGPFNLTFDSFGTLYFLDYDDNGNPKICKLNADNTITVFTNIGTNYPFNLIADNSGNLIFCDYDSNWQTEINKLSSDSSVSTLLPGGPYYPDFLKFDSVGNLYFRDSYNWPNSIKMMTPDGNVTLFASDVLYPNSLLFRDSDNLFFIDYDNNWRPKIKVILNPNYVCPTTIPTPFTTIYNICYNSNTDLEATGIGELKWYDSAVDGNLIHSGSIWTSPTLTSDTTYYIEASFCNSTSNRVPVTINVIPLPVIDIVGQTTNNDYVSLTASGGTNYLWSGGNSPSSASNIFTRSGTYSVTVSDEYGCFSNSSVSVTVNKKGVSKYGQLVEDPTLRVNKNGTINTVNYVTKHGKSAFSISTDGNLNYKIFTSPADYVYNSDGFATYTDPNNQTSSGVNDGAILFNWDNYGVLTYAGISIPNNGDHFSVEVTGFFVPVESGTYTFTCEGDDAVDIFIDGVNVANHYGPHGIDALGSHTGTIDLTAGTKYTLRARMQENGGGEGLRVFWRRPSESYGWNLYTDELTSN